MQKTATVSARSFFTPTAILLAYLACSYAPFHYYALQIMCIGVLVFFAVKKLKKNKKIALFAPTSSFETAILCFSFLFLTGATGVTHSPFFALTFILLFFLIFSESVIKALIDITLIFLFFIALEPSIGLQEIELLASVPIIVFLLFFAKRQYDQSKLKESLLQSETKMLDETSSQEQTLELFTKNFLRPKLHFISTILEEDNNNKENALQQVNLSITELDKILSKVAVSKSHSSAQTTDTKS